MLYIGIDIGGTKCAVSLGSLEGEDLKVIEKRRIPTDDPKPYSVLSSLLLLLNSLLADYSLEYGDIKSLGISCGGPLDSRKGIVMSPPNLPTWDNVKVVEFFENHTGIPSYLQNDANACAVAEWKYGAGKGSDSMVFLTFGTGFGAGIILNGRLYSGFHDNAGEIGHVRLTQDGPIGYYKSGSVEGWCSGGGLAQIGKMAVKEELEKGNNPHLLEAAGDIDKITAKLIGDLAEKENDQLCIDIYHRCAEKLGLALSMIIDILDPEIIVIGGIYMRSAGLLTDTFNEVIKQEALSECSIVPAGLGEKIGDYAALSIAVINSTPASSESHESDKNSDAEED